MYTTYYYNYTVMNTKKKRNFKKYGNIVQFNRALRMLLIYPYTVHAVQNYYKEIRRRRRSEHTH